MQRCNAPLHTLSPRRILHRRDISSSKRPLSRRKTARTRHLRCNFVPDHSPFHTHPTCHCHSHRLSMPHRDNRYRNAPIASNHRQHIASRTRHRTTSDLLCKCDIYRHCNQIRTFSSSAMHRRCKSFLRRCRTFAHWACNRGIAYRRGIPLRTLHSLPKHYRHIHIECRLCKAMHRFDTPYTARLRILSRKSVPIATFHSSTYTRRLRGIRAYLHRTLCTLHHCNHTDNRQLSPMHRFCKQIRHSRRIFEPQWHKLGTNHTCCHRTHSGSLCTSSTHHRHTYILRHRGILQPHSYTVRKIRRHMQ